MTNLTIKITKEVLQATKLCGRVTDKEEVLGENCAIAYGVRELFPKAYVSSQYIALLGAERRGKTNMFQVKGDIINLPEKVQLFIKEFDLLMPAARERMTPIEFTIEIPDEILEKVVDIQEVKELLKNSQTLVLS